MIWAMQKGVCRVWFPTEFQDPKYFDFDKFMFKIDNTIYFQYSKEFEKAVLWEKLKS